MSAAPWRRCRIGIAFLAGGGLLGCATTPETGWAPVEADQVEEPALCLEPCEAEWRRAEEWVKKYSGYPFPSEVIVMDDRIEALRSGALGCNFFDRTRRHRPGVGCVEFPPASEPLGPIDPPQEVAPIGNRAAVNSHATFLVLREHAGDGRSRVRLVQVFAGRDDARASTRQDSFRRFVRTGEVSPESSR